MTRPAVMNTSLLTDEDRAAFRAARVKMMRARVLSEWRRTHDQYLLGELEGIDAVMRVMEGEG